MASLNKVLLIGNLTHDPDLRGLQNGQSVCTLRLAINRRFTNAGGQEQEETCFVDVTVWGKAANNCRQYLAKGSQVMVEGRLRYETWEDRNNGGQRSKLSVVAENVQFMNRRREGEGGEWQGQSGAQQGAYNQPAGGNYQQNNYSQPGNYPPPQNNSYRQSAPPQRQAFDAPPMPDANYNGGDNQMPEDDIPF